MKLAGTTIVRVEANKLAEGYNLTPLHMKTVKVMQTAIKRTMMASCKVVWEQIMPIRKIYVRPMLLDVLEQLASIFQKLVMLLTKHHRVHGN
jgi:hypothetical protein